MKKNNPLIIFALLLLSSCSSLPDWLGSGEDKKLPGERFSVMENTNKITTNPELQSEPVDIPDATLTPSIGSNNGNYALEGNLDKVQSVDAGDAPEDEFFLSYQPVIDGNYIYVIDGHSNITAFDATTLKQKWHKKTDAAKKDRDLPGGGLSIAYGVLYVATGYGELVAISATDGAVVWKKNLGAPLRRPPVVANDKVFAVTIDNQLFALSVIDGATLWRHSGVKESTSFYGSANVAVKGDIVIAAYSSGEIFGISAPRGNELWTEIVSLNSDRESVSGALTDVSASPVIIDGIAYVGSNSGNLDAFNAASGARIWQQKLGPISTTPWVAGKYIYTISQGNQLSALNRFDGRVKWVSSLPVDKDKDKRIFWSGPIMAGAKLVIIGSQGKLLTLDPQDGKILSTTKLAKGIYAPPAVANGKVYMLTREAELIQVK